jgi:hypothetical protein
VNPHLEHEILTFDVALMAQRLPERGLQAFRLATDDQSDALHTKGLRL